VAHEVYPSCSLADSSLHHRILGTPYSERSLIPHLRWKKPDFTHFTTTNRSKSIRRQWLQGVAMQRVMPTPQSRLITSSALYTKKRNRLPPPSRALPHIVTSPIPSTSICSRRRVTLPDLTSSSFSNPHSSHRLPAHLRLYSEKSFEEHIFSWVLRLIRPVLPAL
jgi:hypothetical protein